MKFKILMTMGMKIITIHAIKKKRTSIISDESESETKNADNEENTVKTECHRWLPLHVFYNCF